MEKKRKIKRMDAKASNLRLKIYYIYSIEFLLVNEDTDTSFSMQNKSTMVKVQLISAI